MRNRSAQQACLFPPLLFIAVTAVLSAACGGSAASTAGLSGRSDSRGEKRPTVAVDRAVSVEHISVHRQVDLSGTLLSPDQARVSSEVDGRVQEVLVQLGSVVQPGDVLVRLDTRELQLAVDRAESALNQVLAQLGIRRGQNVEPQPDEQIATVQQASANLEDARATFTRAEQLGDRGLLSTVDRDTAETRFKVSEANYQAALDAVRALKASLQDRRAAFALARKKMDDAVIHAPVAGSVSERLVQPGEFIKADTPVVTIVQMSPLKLRTAVQEKFASIIKPGQTVEFAVEAFPDETFTGRLAYISPAVDQATRTFTVEAIVANEDGRLKPGFFANGIVGTKIDQHVAALPEDAISTLAGVSSVYVVEDGRIRQQTVSLGTRQGKLVEVTAGLKGTETLAASNLSQLATGTQVQIGKAEDRAARREGGQP